MLLVLLPHLSSALVCRPGPATHAARRSAGAKMVLDAPFAPEEAKAANEGPEMLPSVPTPADGPSSLSPAPAVLDVPTPGDSPLSLSPAPALLDTPAGMEPASLLPSSLPSLPSSVSETASSLGQAFMDQGSVFIERDYLPMIATGVLLPLGLLLGLMLIDGLRGLSRLISGTKIEPIIASGPLAEESGEEGGELWAADASFDKTLSAWPAILQLKRRGASKTAAAARTAPARARGIRAREVAPCASEAARCYLG